MVPDIGDITANHSHAPVYAMTEVIVLEGTPYALLPATTAACTTIQPMDAPIPIHTIVAPHSTLTISPLQMPLHHSTD